MQLPLSLLAATVGVVAGAGHPVSLERLHSSAARHWALAAGVLQLPEVPHPASAELLRFILDTTYAHSSITREAAVALGVTKDLPSEGDRVDLGYVMLRGAPLARTGADGDGDGASSSPSASALTMVSGPECPFCDEMREALKSLGHQWRELTVAEGDAVPEYADEDLRRVRHARFNTVPQLYFGGDRIGGADELRREMASGAFDARFASSAAAAERA